MGPMRMAARIETLEKYVEDMRQELQTIANPPTNWDKSVLMTIAKNALAENANPKATP